MTVLLGVGKATMMTVDQPGKPKRYRHQYTPDEVTAMRRSISAMYATEPNHNARAALLSWYWELDVPAPRRVPLELAFAAILAALTFSLGIGAGLAWFGHPTNPILATIYTVEAAAATTVAIALAVRSHRSQ